MARVSAIVVAVLCLLSPVLNAQATPEKEASHIAHYVWYNLDSVAPGKWDTYTKVVSEFRAAATAGAPDFYWIAATRMTGPSGHVAFVAFYDDMASVEKGMAAMEAAAKVATTKNANFPMQAMESAPMTVSVIAEYNKDLSFRPDFIPMSEVRWWMSELISMNPGCGDDLRQVAKQAIATYQKSPANDHWILYDIRSGLTQPSVLLVTPLRSLADRDQEPAAVVKEAFQAPAFRQMFAKFEKECVKQIETTYGRIEPSLSRPMPALVAANPEFWTIKEEPTAAAANKPRGKKAPKATLEPATMKDAPKQ